MQKRDDNTYYTLHMLGYEKQFDTLVEASNYATHPDNNPNGDQYFITKKIEKIVEQG